MHPSACPPLLVPTATSPQVCDPDIFFLLGVMMINFIFFHIYKFSSNVTLKFELINLIWRYMCIILSDFLFQIWEFGILEFILD